MDSAQQGNHSMTVDGSDQRVGNQHAHLQARTPTVQGSIRTEIIRSWRRSALHGIRPEQLDIPYEPDLVERGRLERASQPVLDRVGDLLANSDVSVILADANARIVDRRARDHEVRTQLDRIYLAHGFRYSEDGVGTNAIGTALAQGGPSVVQLDEHFADAFLRMLCAAAPIVDPRTGDIVGVVDLTAVDQNEAPLMLAVAASAAREIELRLGEDVAGQDRIILDRFVEARRRTKGALVSLSAHRMIANAAARQVVRDSDRELLWDRACRSFFGQGPSAATIRLATGDAVAISCDPIMDGTEPVGALIRLTPSSSTQLPRPVVGWSSLTESERAIAHLVAQGMTNREAATHLFVSRHTVGAHLRQIFRKLEINSRVQLAHLVALHEEDRPAGTATAPRDKDT
jgi:DNA-binding CsgD family transcriptional regulator